MPGSTAAGVPDLIDRVLAVEPAHELRRFRNALGAFEREARVRHSRTWLALSDAERGAVLTEAAGDGPGGRAGPGLEARRAGAARARVGTATATHPARPPRLPARHGRADAYFATERGAKEIGWDGNEIFEGLPTCSKSPVRR